MGGTVWLLLLWQHALYRDMMFGRMRKKDRTAPPDSGLLYAGSRAPEPEPQTGDIRHTFELDGGTLEIRNDAIILEMEDGTITIPYHQIEAWDTSGKKFRVWWSTGGRDPHNYRASCTPKQPPDTIDMELRAIIHRNTYAF